MQGYDPEVHGPPMEPPDEDEPAGEAEGAVEVTRGEGYGERCATCGGAIQTFADWAVEICGRYVCKRCVGALTARAELAQRGQERVVEAFTALGMSGHWRLEAPGPGRYAIRRLPDAPEPELEKVRPWRFYRGRLGSLTKLLVCSRCGWSGEFTMPEGPKRCPRCGVGFGPGRTVDEGEPRPLETIEVESEEVRPWLLPSGNLFCPKCEIKSAGDAPRCYNSNCGVPFGEPRPLEETDAKA